MFPDEQDYQEPRSAALAVAVMFAVMAGILMFMKKSGFRAMVAVGG